MLTFVVLADVCAFSCHVSYWCTSSMTVPREIAGAAYRGELQEVVKWVRKGGHMDALAEDGGGLLPFTFVERLQVSQLRALALEHLLHL